MTLAIDYSFTRRAKTDFDMHKYFEIFKTRYIQKAVETGDEFFDFESTVAHEKYLNGFYNPHIVTKRFRNVETSHPYFDTSSVEDITFNIK